MADVVKRAGNPLRGPMAHLLPQVGETAGKATLQLIARFGTAGTGRAIRALHGVARDRAALAALGNGPLLKGGRGMAGGSKVLTAVEVTVTGAFLAAALGAEYYYQSRAEAAPQGSPTID